MDLDPPVELAQTMSLRRKTLKESGHSLQVTKAKSWQV